MFKVIMLIAIVSMVVLSGCTEITQQQTQATCLTAGETTAVTQNMISCCPGLNYIPTSTTNEYGECQPTVGAVVCSNCGNGICEDWESECTCLNDCAPTQTQNPEYEELENELNTMEDANSEEIQAIYEN